MSLALGRGARALAIAAVVVAWAATAHYTTALVDASSWGALLGLAPFALVAAGFARRAPQRLALLALLALAVLAIALVWPVLERNVGWLYFIQHAGTNALLGVVFARTLRRGHVPICTRIAGLMHREVSVALARYTRGVTVAWTLFFAVTTLASAGLFAFGPIAAWSTFANLLTLPLVGAMFAAEYFVRVRVLPPHERGGILDAARVYWRSASADAPSPESAVSATAPTPAER